MNNNHGSSDASKALGGDYVSWLFTKADVATLQHDVKVAHDCLIKDAVDGGYELFSYIDQAFVDVQTLASDTHQHLYLIVVAMCTSLRFVDYIQARGTPAAKLGAFVRVCQSVLQHLLTGHVVETSYLFYKPDDSGRYTCFRHAVSELRNIYHMLL